MPLARKRTSTVVLRHRDRLDQQFQDAALFVRMQDFPDGIDALQGVGDVGEFDRVSACDWLWFDLADGSIQRIQLAVESLEFVRHEVVLVAEAQHGANRVLHLVAPLAEFGESVRRLRARARRRSFLNLAICSCDHVGMPQQGSDLVDDQGSRSRRRAASAAGSCRSRS